MTAAENLANAEARRADLLENERDQAALERDRAQGEADAQGVQLREFGAWLTAEHAKLAHVGGPVARTYAKVLARYGQIEGSA